jgi:hypothetical protein
VLSIAAAHDISQKRSKSLLVRIAFISAMSRRSATRSARAVL